MSKMMTTREILDNAIEAYSRDITIPTVDKDAYSPKGDPGMHVRRKANGSAHFYFPDPEANRHLVEGAKKLFRSDALPKADRK